MSKINKFLAKLFTKFPKLVERSAKKVVPVHVEGTMWTPMTKPLSECKVALVTSAGVHLKTQIEFDMDDRDGDSTYRELPVNTKADEYMITHDYYDHIDADKDINVVFPVDRLSELNEEGFICVLAETNFGFMGHIVGRHLDEFLNVTTKEIAQKLKDQGVDVVVLTPG